MRGKGVIKLVPLLLSSYFIAWVGVHAAPFEPINFPNPTYPPAIKLEVLGTYRVGFFNSKGAEIVAHDPNTQRLFVVNVAEFPDNGEPPQKPRLDVLSIKDPANPTLEFFIDLSTVYSGLTTVPTSVAVYDGMVAVAVHQRLDEGSITDQNQAPGKVLFYNAAGDASDGPVNVVEIFGIPDMVTFTPNGKWVLSANVASLSTPGSVSVIEFGTEGKELSLRLADFGGFDLSNLPAGVRYIPGLDVARSLAPEYVAVSSDSRTAMVTLEANNAIAMVDIQNAMVTAVLPLGRKDHSLADNGFVAFDGVPGSNALDPSDKDGGTNIANWPVFGMYQPDAIASYLTQGGDYMVTANEGNTFNDIFEVRAENLPLCPGADAKDFLKDSELGRLQVTRLPLSDYGFNGLCFNDLYAFGARSFSIWSPEGQLVFDSGDDFERITAQAVPNFFNTNDTENRPDKKSDEKGPEAEGVTVGTILGRHYAFVVLERIGGIMVYDVTDPMIPRFQLYINNRNFSIDIKQECQQGMPESQACASVRDLGPEGVLFIKRDASPIATPLLVVANETSGSTTVYRIDMINND